MIYMILHTTTVHIDDHRVDLGPPHPSARLPHDASTRDPGVARTLSYFTSLYVWWDSVQLDRWY
jgi:hypothetical protein